MLTLIITVIIVFRSIVNYLDICLVINSLVIFLKWISLKINKW